MGITGCSGALIGFSVTLMSIFSVGKRATEALKGSNAKCWWDRWEMSTTVFPFLLRFSLEEAEILLRALGRKTGV